MTMKDVEKRAAEINMEWQYNRELCGKSSSAAAYAYSSIPRAKEKYEKALAYYNLNPSSWSSKRTMERAKEEYESLLHTWETAF